MGEAFSPVNLLEEGGQEAKGEQARMVRFWFVPCGCAYFHVLPTLYMYHSVSMPGLHCWRSGHRRPGQNVSWTKGHGQDPPVGWPWQCRFCHERWRHHPKIGPHRCETARVWVGWA